MISFIWGVTPCVSTHFHKTQCRHLQGTRTPGERTASALPKQTFPSFEILRPTHTHTHTHTKRQCQVAEEMNSQQHWRVKLRFRNYRLIRHFEVLLFMYSKHWLQWLPRRTLVAVELQELRTVLMVAKWVSVDLQLKFAFFESSSRSYN
jgi:hypothetical protein